MISGGGRGGQRFHVHGLEGSRANQMRRSSRIVAISLVGCERLERLMGLPALDAHRGGPRRLDVFTNSPATAAAPRRHLGLVNGHTLAVENAHMRKTSSYWLPPPKSEETGEAHPVPGTRIRHVRRRGSVVPANKCRRRQSPPQAARVFQHRVMGWELVPHRPIGSDYLLASISRWIKRSQLLKKSSCSTSDPTIPLIEFDGPARGEIHSF